MKASSLFALLLCVGAALIALSGCGNVGPAPLTSPIPVPPNATPPAKWLYVDHDGTFYEYSLPLNEASKPVRVLDEWPRLGFPPTIAVGPYGDVAVASPTSLRIFHPPITSFDPKGAKLSIKLTPAITEVGTSGADLVDMEYDPNDNLWLLNNLGPEIDELPHPLSKQSISTVRVPFGQPGSKTAGFTSITEARFDVNATLYVYASSTTRRRLFKLAFPYAKQPSGMGIDLSQADFVDSSQYLPASKNPASVILGQYYGPLHSPHPGDPPSPPVDALSQFDEPLMPVNGLFPSEHTGAVVGALAADAPRQLFYTLDLSVGSLSPYTLPMPYRAQPKFTLSCLGGASQCGAHEHLFLAP